MIHTESERVADSCLEPKDVWMAPVVVFMMLMTADETILMLGLVVNA